MHRAILPGIATLALASVVMLAGIANAAEIKVIGSPGFREAYTELVPAFEKASGHTVTPSGPAPIARTFAPRALAN